jgi:hypothetical protein
VKPDDRWNVPIGYTAGKRLKIGKLPIKIQLGADYSMVPQDDFGHRWKFKLLISPVIPSIIKKPLLD